MRKILIPTDFSENATAAAKYTFGFFEQEKCKFYHLHSIESEVGKMSNLSDKFTQSIKENALLELNKLKSLFTITNTKFANKQKTILSFNNIVKAVKNNIKKHDINLVVMGTKGATGLKKMLYGSNTVNVIDKLDSCATLIVPDDIQFKEVKKIGFPTDLKTVTTEVVEEIKTLANLHDATIMIMHVMGSNGIDEKQHKNLNKLKEALKDVDYYFHPVPSEEAKTEEILYFIDDSDIDILIMAKNEHDFIEKIIKEPVIKNLGYKINIPLLVMPYN